MSPIEDMALTRYGRWEASHKMRTLYKDALPRGGDKLGAALGVAPLPDIDQVDAVLTVTLEDLVCLEDVLRRQTRFSDVSRIRLNFELPCQE